MKRYKAVPLLALLAVLIMGTLAACGGGGAASGSASSAAAEPTVDDLKAKITEASTAKFDNVTFDMNMGVDMQASGMSMQMGITGTGEMDKSVDPMKMHMLMNIDALGQKSTSEVWTDGADVVTVTDGGDPVKSTSAEMGQASSMASMSDAFMNAENMNKLIDMAKDWSMTEADGKTTITMTLPPEALAALDESGSLNSLTGASGASLGDMVMTYVVGKDNLVESVNIDMAMNSGAASGEAAASDAAASAEAASSEAAASADAAASDAAASDAAADAASSIQYEATINIAMNFSNYNSTTVPEAPAVS